VSGGRTKGGRRPAEPWGRVVAIAIGGAVGTLARYGTSRAVPAATLGFPWPTFLVNVTGSMLLGLVVTLLVERWPPTRFLRPFVAIGFCGGFTTFSTMVVEAAQRGQHGRAGLAAAYLVVSLAAGLVAAAVGIGLARGQFLPRGGRHAIPDPDDLGLLDGHAAGADVNDGSEP
jgi:fluoride exporter